MQFYCYIYSYENPSTAPPADMKISALLLVCFSSAASSVNLAFQVEGVITVHVSDFIVQKQKKKKGNYVHCLPYTCYNIIVDDKL